MMITPQIEHRHSPIIGLDVPVRTPELPLDREFSNQLLTVPNGTPLPGTPASRLRSDVFASVDWTRDGVVISSNLFEEEGYGRTYDDAWNDFLSSIRDRHDSLARRESRLSAGDKRVLDALRSVIAF